MALDIIPAPPLTEEDLRRAAAREPMSKGIGYYAGPGLSNFGSKAVNLASAVDPIQGIMRGMSASGKAFNPRLDMATRKAAGVEALLETASPLMMAGVGKLANQPIKAIMLDMLTPTGAPSSMSKVDNVGPADPSRRKFLQGAAAAVPVAAVAPDVLSDIFTKGAKAASRVAINPLEMAMENIRILRSQIDEQYGILDEIDDMGAGRNVDLAKDANNMIQRTEQQIIDEAYDALIGMDPDEFAQAIRSASDDSLEEIISVQYDSIAGNQRLADDGPNTAAIAEEMKRRGMDVAKDQNGVDRFPNARTFVEDFFDPTYTGLDSNIIPPKTGVDDDLLDGGVFSDYGSLNMAPTGRQTPPDVQQNILELKLSELRQQINDADKVMRMDGKSTKEIDDFKAQKRREMFELQNLPPDMEDFYAKGGLVSGVGSLNRVARDMFRGPKGIESLSRFAEGGTVGNRYTGFDDDRESLEALANVEYASDMQKYLQDPLSQLGFDPKIVKTTTGQTMYPEDSYSKPFDRLTVDTNYGLYAPEIQTHEFRHRGMYKVINMYMSDPDRFESDFGTDAANYVRSIIKDMRGPQNKIFSEALAEFYENPSNFNYPRYYYSETGDVIQSNEIDSYKEKNPDVNTRAVTPQEDGYLDHFLDKDTRPLVEGFREFKETGKIPPEGLRSMYKGAEGLQSAAEFLLERNPVRGYENGGSVDGSGMSAYRQALIGSESSGRFNLENTIGAVGLTQAMPETLEEFKNSTGLEFTTEEYKRSPELQMQFQDWYEQTTINYIMDNGLDRYIGKIINGVPITMSSLMGMAHLGGNYGMKKFLETEGRYNPADAYGTSLRDYGRKFANLSMSGQGTGGMDYSPEDVLMSMPVQSQEEYTDPRSYSLRPMTRPEYMPTEPMLRPRMRPEDETAQTTPYMGVLPGKRTNLYQKYGGGISTLANP